ncbi:gamma-glutamyltranspeptidase 3-like [Phalaenopsis equestris]|uniref:gamma-glutamyltranspeptidase 3-like n=1 Tax=Phalaenopsis equestris TaxID=78828 RepID=UPI0009E505CB|nr:gamma-glutamyltranspeptidase 3-like [Phalaenopsis equestris]
MIVTARSGVVNPSHFFFLTTRCSWNLSPRGRRQINLTPKHLIPNVVLYENWTAIDDEQIQVSLEAQTFLKQRGHQLRNISGGSVAQFVVHNLQNPVPVVEERKDGIFYGKLTAVSDPRKDGGPAGI